MNCPGCNKVLASTLSVCWSCGTMMNDSVREELSLKVSPLAKPVKPEFIKTARAEKNSAEEIEFKSETKSEIFSESELHLKIESKAAVSAALPKTDLPPITENAASNVKNAGAPPVKLSAPPVNYMNKQSIVPSKPPVKTEKPRLSVEKGKTSFIEAKMTSPTLVEFRHKQSALPEWRLQLQNAVRMRHDRESNAGDAVSAISQPAVLLTNGATAMQAENAPQTETLRYENPKVAAALKRIEQSRQMYFAEEKPKLSIVAAPKSYAPTKAKQPEILPANNDFGLASSSETNLKLSPNVSAHVVEKYDTNKLPPISAKIAKSFEKTAPVLTPVEPSINLAEITETDNTPDVIAYEAAAIAPNAAEVIEDCAPVSLRFNAGLFDLIIGAFITFILLAPFMLANGNLFTISGALAFMATCSIVMFLYLTTTLGVNGRTLGMRLFSLELVNVEDSDYPTFHQAAVNSCVYIFSLALGGIGLLPIFFNEEKRAAHDLISGTIVVREY